MKLVLIPNNKDNISKFNNVDSIIIGLKNYSVNYNVQLDIEEINTLVLENKNLEVFVAFNKNIMNHELSEVEELLKKLSTINIKGVLYYDLAILSIRNRLGLNIDLVWNQTHMVTNYNTCNYYYDKGVKYAFLSPEITLEEMIEIKKHSDIKTFSLLIGHPIMSHSKRTLLTNYYKSMDKERADGVHILNENVSKHKYLIKESNVGTSIIYGNIVNGISCLKDMISNDFDYIVVDSQEIEEDIIFKIVNIVRDVIDNKCKENYVDIVNNIIGEDTGFFFKKTIYKVKKDEK